MQRETKYLLTTVDNKFNPFVDFDGWLAEDRRLGYNIPGMVDRLLVTSDELSDETQAELYYDTIDEICERNVTGTFRRIRPDGTYV